MICSPIPIDILCAALLAVDVELDHGLPVKVHGKEAIIDIMG
jgi:hypothetical protein